ncbi:Modification methylase AplI [Poriferisphaera corsica]|uniref:DNA (cytosine-5-)-methyltransferase n=1 Tax=Poriferisphaera corsica TaxID=2528020 RepID=A0A517YS23_9BACT|nr:DNA cytosine methyltransferase [Poriferisphaera corsica]QDU33024.1 Modification methylase AplI [Poriferisphaera corsica]
MTERLNIPIVDLFAGPGGLGEGFSAYRNSEGGNPFNIAISIEKDERAHMTLQLRSFFRQFGNSVPNDYYNILSDTSRLLPERLKELYNTFSKEAEQASSETWQAELGEEKHNNVRKRIAASIGERKPWVLIGGPPCQAYSLVGRSRNKGNQSYKPDDDKRQYLYVEYLHVIAEHQPAIFVMENVKGLLSATVKNKRMFERIVADLKNPTDALKREKRVVRPAPSTKNESKYEIFSLTQKGNYRVENFQDYVVKMEDYGIPQARHRVIILGVRKDLLGHITPNKLTPQKQINTKSILQGLPKLRSGLSKEVDSGTNWYQHIKEIQNRKWFSDLLNSSDENLACKLKTTLEKITIPKHDRGGEFVEYNLSIGHNKDWFLDDRLEGAWNHTTRGHIVKDIYRYLFVSSFGAAHKRSPVLADFPKYLLPNHDNVKSALNGSLFADRFRVQLGNRPSTTITSHISKDGHYYIHHDPAQCRSLTVREAARLQTFPDNYFFCGPRTSQYGQVGNAVPPLLANQIADIVFQLLNDTGILN